MKRVSYKAEYLGDNEFKVTVNLGINEYNQILRELVSITSDGDPQFMFYRDLVRVMFEAKRAHAKEVFKPEL